MNNDITVILNGYRRPNYFKEQFEAVSNQTLQPKNIFFFNNFHPETFDKFDENIVAQCVSTRSNANFGVWGRFAHALNARTKYVCIFDDDTIPGSKWLENCIETSRSYPGLLGTRGVVFDSKSNYWQNKAYGWESKNEETVQVDILGHCWFFEKEWLTAYWRELPPPEFFFAGEDMHFSYTIQKYLGLKTYVPPHPANDKEMWGSLKAGEYGGDKEATSAYAGNHIGAYYNYLISKGFKIIKDPS
jgi:Glycosyl transferase family 2